MNEAHLVAGGKARELRRRFCHHLVVLRCNSPYDTVDELADARVKLHRFGHLLTGANFLS